MAGIETWSEKSAMLRVRWSVWIGMLWIRWIAWIVMLWTMVLLSACMSESEINEWDMDVDVVLYTGDMDLQADKIQIWWDDSFGVTFKEYMGEHLKKAFPGHTFEVFQFQ